MRRSSPFDEKPLLGSNILNALQQTGDRFIICSCRGNERAPEVGEKGLGSFIYRLILGLCGPASEPTTNQITLQRLQAFLLKSFGEQQRPQLFGQERIPLVLVGDMHSLSTPQIQHAPVAKSQSGQLPPLPSGSLSAQQSGNVSTAFAATAALQGAVTAQMSPTASGEITLSPAEQQCAMLVKQARHLIQMQNPNEAFNIVEQALSIGPTDVAALVLKGQLLGTVGRFEEAIYVVGLVLQIDPNNALPWSMRAALLTNTGQYHLALQAIERSLELDPNNPETYSIKTSIMGQIAAEQSQYKSKSKSQKLRAVNHRGPPSFSTPRGSY